MGIVVCLGMDWDYPNWSGVGGCWTLIQVCADSIRTCHHCIARHWPIWKGGVCHHLDLLGMALFDRTIVF